MLRHTALTGPTPSAINGVNNRSFSANRPTFAGIQKLYVKEIDIHPRLLLLPSPAAVGCLINIAAAANSPAQPVIDKGSGSEAHGFLYLRQARLIPGVPAI